MRSSQLIQGKPAPDTRPSQGLVSLANERRLTIERLALVQDNVSIKLYQRGKIFLTNEVGPDSQRVLTFFVDPKNSVQRIGSCPCLFLNVEDESAHSGDFLRAS